MARSTTDVATVTATPADALNGVTNLADAFAALNAAGLIVADVADFDDSAWGPTIDDKDKLLGTPFLIAEAKFHQGDFGPFVACLCVNEHGEKFVFTDGSTGVYRQMENISDKHNGPVFAPRGLRRSDYEKDGRAARTYYLA